MRRGCITLLTDFGTRDSYAAEMKGVILGVNPRAVIVDLSHEVPPGDVREAAWLLRTASASFPAGTVHAVVVDPGVGSERKILCAKTRRGFFLGPDNGVLSLVLERDRPIAVRELANSRFFLKAPSAAFHGRDKIAPAAAHLSARDIFRRLGPSASWRRLDWPHPVFGRGVLRGTVIRIDRFGSLITNVTASDLGLRCPVGTDPRVHRGDRPQYKFLYRGLSPLSTGVSSHSESGVKRTGFRFSVRRRLIRGLSSHYAQAEPGEFVALLGSAGFLEIALRDGSAAERISARPGDPVWVYSVYSRRRPRGRH